jgi:hypothetical protein
LCIVERASWARLVLRDLERIQHFDALDDLLLLLQCLSFVSVHKHSNNKVTQRTWYSESVLCNTRVQPLWCSTRHSATISHTALWSAMSLGISFSFLAMVTSLFDSGTNRSALGTLDDNTACCGAVLLIGAGATYRCSFWRCHLWPFGPLRANGDRSCRGFGSRGLTHSWPFAAARNRCTSRQPQGIEPGPIARYYHNANASLRTKSGFTYLGDLSCTQMRLAPNAID